MEVLKCQMPIDTFIQYVKNLMDSQDVYAEEDNEIREENNDGPKEITFPGFPIFEEKQHCFCKMTYYPEIDTYFWGEWEFQPFMPAVVILLITSSYLFSLFFCLPKYGSESFFIIPTLTFFCVMFLVSYIQIIKTGPGYFPFYWGSRQTPQNQSNSSLVMNHENDDETSGYLLGTNKLECPKDGIMTNDEQYKWAHQLDRPERSILARSARRIVLRPDHLCGWTTVWIGKRNHKLFMLFNFYGFFYLTLLVIYLGRDAISQVDKLENIPIFICEAIYSLFAISFAMMTFSFSYTSLLGFQHNVTSWEEWNQKNLRLYDRGSFRKNLEDVCGPSTNLCDWLKPISPFTNYSNEELSNQYLSIRRENEQQI